MERIFEETFNRHFYTNDYNNCSDQGDIKSMDANAVIPEDTLNYLLKKYNIKLA